MKKLFMTLAVFVVLALVFFLLVKFNVIVLDLKTSVLFIVVGSLVSGVLRGRLDE